MVKIKGLGRGLSSLLGDHANIINVQDLTNQNKNNIEETISEINIKDIIKSDFQPRKYFNEKDIKELAESIEKQGLLQPILVRYINKKNKYEIIIGERRYRACKLLGFEKIPAIIKNFDEKNLLPIALIENIQRNQLSPIEEAEAYLRLTNDYKYTHENIANIIGKSRSHITNLIRLLSLPPKVQNYVNEGKLTIGHAKLLIGKINAEETADRIVLEDLTIREAEEIFMKNLMKKNSDKKAYKNFTGAQDDDLIQIEKMLEDSLNMKVEIKHNNKGGKMILSFENLEQLDFLLKKLSVE